jgi:hypothetical protein
MSETTTHGTTCTCGQTFPTTEDLADHLAAHQTDLNPQDRSTRDPTEDELIDLFNRYRNQMGYSRSQAAGITRQSYYTVIEDYQTGCPGYHGRVLIEITDSIVVSPGSVRAPGEIHGVGLTRGTVSLLAPYHTTHTGSRHTAPVHSLSRPPTGGLSAS